MWSGADGSVGREFWLLLQNNADKGKGGREAGRQAGRTGRKGWDGMRWDAMGVAGLCTQRNARNVGR